MLRGIGNGKRGKSKSNKKKKITDNVNIMFPEIREIVNDEPTKNKENKNSKRLYYFF